MLHLIARYYYRYCFNINGTIWHQNQNCVIVMYQLQLQMKCLFANVHCQLLIVFANVYFQLLIVFFGRILE